MSRNRFHTGAARPRRPTLVAGAAALGALAALGVGLLGVTASDAAPAKGPAVRTDATGLGRILVDAGGRTLYLFEKDKNGKSACTGMCAAFWPPLIASGKPLVDAGAKASLLGTIRRADGRLQVTYNHHPLYTFAKDTRRARRTARA